MKGPAPGRPAAEDGYSAIREAARLGQAPPVVLLHGDDFLCRSAIQELTALLVPEGLRQLNVVELDAGASPRQVAEEVRTIPMFRGAKVVTVQPAEFLAPQKASGKTSGRSDPFAKARELWEEGKQRDAARRVLALAGRAGFSLDEMAARSAADWKAAGFALGSGDLGLLAKVAQLAHAEGLAIPESDGRPLEELLARGLPLQHYLLAAVEELDDKSPVVRLCRTAGGCVLERALPVEAAAFGKRPATSVTALAAEVLGPLGKSLSPEAARALASSAVVDARRLAGELAKLAAYAGDRKVIEVGDVRELVPEGAGSDLFAVSNALEARDARALVGAVDEELARGAVPLQILGSLASTVRGLLAARARLAVLGMERRFAMEEFERRALPAFTEADERAGKKAGHPFRYFKRAEASLRYSVAELGEGLCELATADAGIKRGMDGRLWLTRLAMELCG